MPGVRKLKRYHHGDLRRALLDAALDLLRGGELVGLREVARRAGVSHTAPYRHFADKDALLAAVAEEGFRALTAALLAAEAAVVGDALARYYACGIAYVHFAVAHPAHYRVMFGGAWTPGTEGSSLVEAGREAFGVLLRLIEETQRAGFMRPGSSLELATAIWSAEHGLAMLEIDLRVPILAGNNVDERARLVHRLLLEGLAAPKRRK